MPFISSFPLGHFCAHSRSTPEMGSENCCVICRQRVKQGKDMKGKLPDCEREPRLTFCIVLIDTCCFCFTFLSCWETLSSANKTSSCRIECVQNVKREVSVGSLQKLATLLPCTQKVPYFLAPDSPPWQATFLHFMYFMSGSFSEDLSSIFLSSKYKAGIKLCFMIQSIGQCFIEITACGIIACNFHRNTHLRVCGYFSISLKREVILVLDLVNSCRVSLDHILLMTEFDPAVSLIVWSLSIFVCPAIPLSILRMKKRGLVVDSFLSCSPAFTHWGPKPSLDI